MCMTENKIFPFKTIVQIQFPAMTKCVYFKELYTANYVRFYFLAILLDNCCDLNSLFCKPIQDRPCWQIIDRPS